MVDTRLRGEWLNMMQFDALSDTAWRVFTGGLMWCNENGSDGFVPNRYLRMLHPDGASADSCNEIVRAQIWTPREGGYQFLDWDGALGQSTAEYVRTHKENARDRQRKYRESERKKLVKKITVTGDVTRDVTGDVGEGKGKGKGDVTEGGSDTAEWVENEGGDWVQLGSGEVVESPVSKVTGWPVAEIGQGRKAS